MRNSVSWIMILLFVALITLSGCEEAEEEEYSAQEWIEKGLHYLGLGDGTSAYIAFSEARKLDKTNLDAKYGQVLANVLQMQGTFDLVLDLFADSEDVLASAQSVPAADDDDAAYGVPDAELCQQACEAFSGCGYLENVGWSVSLCAERCPAMYPAESLECFTTLGDCDLAYQNCFTHFGPGLQSLLDDIFADIIIQMAGNMDSILDQPDWTMLIPKYNFTILDLFFQPGLSGENDLAEAYMMNSISNMYDGVFNILFAMNLDFNPVALASLDLDTSALQTFDFSDINDQDLNALVEFLQGIQGLIDILLKDPIYPDFLSLNGEEGIYRVQEAATNFGTMFGDLAKMIEWIDLEFDEQEDDAVRYIDENGNLEWDDNEMLLIPGVGAMEKELAFAVREILVSLKINFIDGRPFPLNSFNDLLSYYDLEWASVILDILYVLDMGEIDLAQGLRDPDPEGFKNLLQGVSDLLGVVIVALQLLAA